MTDFAEAVEDNSDSAAGAYYREMRQRQRARVSFIVAAES
jgi:hypothetical protein